MLDRIVASTLLAARLAAVTSAALLLPTTSRAAESLNYTIYTGDGQRGGEQRVERSDDGAITVHYRFKNNGRGPELVEHLHVGPDGSIDDYEVTGTAEMGGPVNERFSRRGDRAEWKSSSEQGAAEVGDGALYVPVNGSFEAASIGIGLLSARPDGALPLLPSGSLRQRRIDEVDVTRDGQTRRVQLLAQTGLGFSPALYWATTDAQPRLFTSIYPGWMTLIEGGWDRNAKMLEERQQAAAGDLLKQLATTLRQPMHGLGVVRNARVFDSQAAKLGPLQDVYLQRGRITAVVPAGTLALPVDEQIDAGGRVMLPGLFDMHAHVDRWDGPLQLAAGVTTVRDMGNENAKIQQMLDEIDAGELLAPHIVPCGFLEGDSPNAAHMGFIIKTFDEAKAAVDWYAGHGYPQLKIYNSFPREMVRGIVAYAHQRGMRVSGHVPAFMRAQDVVEQGFDEIQHINQVMLNFLVTPTTDTRTLERFYLPAQKVAGLDFESQPVLDFIALLKAHGTTIDPTLATFDFMQQRDGEMSAPYAAIADHVPPDIRRSFLSGGLKIPDDATAATYKASYAKMVDFVGRLHRAGVPIVAGTDSWPGFTLHSELGLYVKAGLTPPEVLQIATLKAAQVTRTDGDRGRIAAGQRADLVLFDGDPTTAIADLRKVALVITQGSMLSPSALYEASGVRPFVQREPALPSKVATSPVK